MMRDDWRERSTIADDGLLQGVLTVAFALVCVGGYVLLIIELVDLLGTVVMVE